MRFHFPLNLRRQFFVSLALVVLILATGRVSSFDIRAEGIQISPPTNRHSPLTIPKIFDLNKRKSTCCGGEQSEAVLSFLNPQYESYKLTGTYYALRENLSTSLMLNNKGPEPISATPTFYSLRGTRLILESIVVPASSYIEVDMQQLLAGVADEFRDGSLKIAYQGSTYQLGAQIKMVNEQDHLIWAEQMVYTSKFTSNRLEAVWWLPYENSTTRVVVSNTSAGTVTASIVVDGTAPRQSSPAQISLAPWETRVLDIVEDIAGHQSGHVQDNGGISIVHSGSPGAVLARMLVDKPSRGYSASIPFIDPENTTSQRWHGNGLRLRNLNGETLRPVIVARNTSDQPSTVTGRIPYTLSNGDMAEIIIPSMVIPAGSTRLEDLRNLIQNANLPTTVGYAGIELEYSTANGTVIAAVQSISQSGDHVFQVPIYDPMKVPSSAGGFPWKADGDYSTIVYIKNESAATKKYTASLVYGDGHGYSLGVREIKGRQTIAIDFRQLRDSETPDSQGNVIPLDLDRAQIAWSSLGGENKVLSGRSEQVSVLNGLASTYACANCCPNRYYDSWLTPFSVLSEIGDVTQFVAIQQDQNCYGQTYPPYQAGLPFWNSTDWAVASVNSGSATAQGIGTANIEASWEGDNWWYESERCDYIPVPVLEDASVEVRPRVEILRDSQPITTAQNVIVGQRMNLRAQVTGGTATSYQWNIPGDVADKYETVNAHGQPDSSRTPARGRTIAISGLTSDSVSYVWYNGGGNNTNKQVEVTATVNGVPYSATANFTVSRPTTTMTYTGGQTKIDNSTPEIYLGGVSPGDVGIKIVRSNTSIPTGFSGSFQYVQLISGHVVRTPIGQSPVTTNITSGLDGCYPYTTNDTTLADKPGFLLSTQGITFSFGQYVGNWTTYLMFKPSGTGSNWVTLRKLSWSWDGSATLVPNSNPLQWTPSDTTTPGNGTGSDSTEFPIWTAIQPDNGGCIG